jgi:hypothetical protein
LKKVTVALVVMASVCLLILGVPGQGAAQQYLGETTWTVSITQNKHGTVSPPETFTFTGAVTRMGGTYYTVQGYATVPSDNPDIVSGGGVLIGNTVYLTLTHSLLHTDTNRDSAVLHLELDKATLNGTVYDVGHDFDTATEGPSPVFSDHFSAGTLTRTGPFINLTPGDDGRHVPATPGQMMVIYRQDLSA